MQANMFYLIKIFFVKIDFLSHLLHKMFNVSLVNKSVKI